MDIYPRFGYFSKFQNNIINITEPFWNISAPLFHQKYRSRNYLRTDLSSKTSFIFFDRYFYLTRAQPPRLLRISLDSLNTEHCKIFRMFRKILEPMRIFRKNFDKIWEKIRINSITFKEILWKLRNCTSGRHKINWYLSQS